MTHYIYIPGLGDHFDLFRRAALRRWRHADTKVTFVPMHWSDKSETWQAKYRRVEQVINEFDSSDTVLVGESAGGAMAVYGVASDQTGKLRAVTICGYNHGADGIHPGHKLAHPAFYQLVPEVDKAIDELAPDKLSRIKTIYSTKDHTVRPSHSKIDGARSVETHTSGHLRSIVRNLLAPKDILDK